MVISRNNVGLIKDSLCRPSLDVLTLLTLLLSDYTVTHMNPTLILNLPPKFMSLLQEAVAYRISSMQHLLDNPSILDEELAEIDYGNDQMILKIIDIYLRNTNNQIEADFYQLSQNESLNQTTLKLFGEPVEDEEEIVFVFSAKSYDDAMTIRNRFLGFPLYKPMSDN